MKQNTTSPEGLISYFRFPSGLRLVHRQVASPVAYAGIMVGAGTRDEMPEENGMAHYIEHCVFKGTSSRNSRQIINRIENIGGDINAYTTKEETTFYAAVPAEHFARTLSLLADMVFHPSFPKTETDKERQVIYDEIESYNDSPSELIYDDFEALVFAGHPLAMPILGTKKSLRRFSAEKVYAFMRRCYLPDRMVVFVESPASFSQVRKMVDRCVESLTQGRVYAPAADVPLAVTEQDARLGKQYVYTVLATYRTFEFHEKRIDRVPVGPERNSIYHKHTHQAHVMLGGRAYPLGHERQLAMYLLNNILGGGSMNSLLNLSLREQKGLVYTVESIYTPLSDTGYWSVYLACEPENREECIALVKKQLKALQDKPLSDAAMARALRQLRGQMAVSSENRENSALTMGKQMLYYNQSPSWEQTFARIARFTPADLQAVAGELFRDDNIFCLQYC